MSNDTQIAALMALLNRFENQVHRMGELWNQCQGKVWPEKESDEFAQLRDVKVPATRAAVEASARQLADQPDYDALEREHMGDFEKKTGIYASPTAPSTEASEPVGEGEAMRDALELIREHCKEQPSVLAKAIVATCDSALAARTAPPPAPVLSDAEILALWSGSDTALRPVLGGRKVITFARAIEQAGRASRGRNEAPTSPERER